MCINRMGLSILGSWTVGKNCQWVLHSWEAVARITVNLASLWADLHRIHRLPQFSQANLRHTVIVVEFMGRYISVV